MGATDSKPITKLYDHFRQINVYNNDFPECQILQHKRDPHQKLILRTLNITDEVHFKKAVQQYQVRHKINHQNVLNLSNYFYQFEQQLCGQFYKVYLLFEYPTGNLELVPALNETQLVQYLKQAVAGLACMQKNEIPHNSLQLKYLYLMDEIIKVTDPMYFQHSTNFMQVLQNPNCLECIYLSPILVKSIQLNNWQPKHNEYKSDLFTLGMLFLHLALNQPSSDCYSYEQGLLIEDVLNSKLQKLKMRYGQQFCDWITTMLIIKEDQRPDFLQMEQYITNQQQVINKQQYIPNIIQRQIIPIIDPTYQSNTIQTLQQHTIVANNTIQPCLTQVNSVQQIQSRRVQQVQNISPLEYVHQYTIKTDTSQRSLTPLSKILVPQQQLQVRDNRDSSVPRLRGSRQSSKDVNQTYTYAVPTIPTDLSILSNKSGQVKQIYFPPKPLSNKMQNTRTITQQQQQQQQQSRLNYTTQQVQEYQFSSQTINNIQKQVTPILSLQPDQCDTLQFKQPSETVSKQSQFDENIDPQPDEDVEQTTQRQEYFKFSKILSDSTNLPQQITTTQTKEFSLPYDIPQFKADSVNRPEFVVEHYSNGSRYEGMKANGMRHGQGKFYYQDGGLYDGGWKENKMHGDGTLYYATGQPAYQGQWSEDQFQGHGTLYNEHPQPLQESFDYRDFDNVEDYWIKYSGNFDQDNKEGQGTLYLTNGERFVGTFQKDFINGPGIFYCMNGKIMDGRWVNNKLVY
ncbi:unnamed protein product [Paramecium primaurelia]|uniref:Protein kinase domain-containing protein n=1 Tax=Paramecium primaurelia TaxID=5886 RepID=A0A8S1N9I1_PARPR|nr:unnamed protein product [Paramecium primaurelia]